jgi:hypothetical protein
MSSAIVSSMTASHIDIPAGEADVAALRRSVVARLTYSVGRDPIVATDRDQVYDGMRGEMDTAEQALNLLVARFKMEHSVPGRGLDEVNERFRRQTAPILEQL